jgi:protein-S-isoprenylcysteine O-methyltransferase Ste14
VSFLQPSSTRLQTGDDIFPASEGRAQSASPWETFQTTKLYDFLASIPLIGWFGFCGLRQLSGLLGQMLQARSDTLDIPFIVSLLAQIAAVFFILVVLAFLLLRNPAKAKAHGLMPRFFAFVGGYLGVGVVLLPRHDLSVGWSVVSLLLILGGVGFSTFAVFHLGRSFSVMAEARRLVTDGPYAEIRHPLYLGEAISMLGLMLQFISPLAVLIVFVQLAFQLARMSNEERVLSGMFPEYAAYAARTARLVPGIY